MNLLQAHDWPGNVRELKNTAEYLFIHCRNSVVQIENLPPEIQTRGGFAPATMKSTGPWTSSAVVNEKDKVLAALASADGNRTRAARMLGISRATLYRHLDRLGIPTSRH